MSLWDHLPHTFSVSRVTASQGTYVSNKLTKAAAPYVEDQSGFAQPADAKTVTEFAARSQAVTHVIYVQELPSGLKMSDLIDITSGPYDGGELKVIAWRECTAGLNNGWKIVCEQNRER
jgi:hypothetical protein